MFLLLFSNLCVSLCLSVFLSWLVERIMLKRLLVNAVWECTPKKLVHSQHKSNFCCGKYIFNWFNRRVTFSNNFFLKLTFYSSWVFYFFKIISGFYKAGLDNFQDWCKLSFIYCWLSVITCNDVESSWPVKLREMSICS